MASKMNYYDITIHIPYLEKQLEALIYLGEKVMSIATAAQRLVEIGFQTWQQAKRYDIENARVCYQASLDAVRERDLAKYEQLKAEGKLFSIWLVNCGPQKIRVIKTIRELTNLGLKEAKDIADRAPCCMKEYVVPDQISRFLEVIQAAGGRAEARPQS